MPLLQTAGNGRLRGAPAESVRIQNEWTRQYSNLRRGTLQALRVPNKPRPLRIVAQTVRKWFQLGCFFMTACMVRVASFPPTGVQAELLADVGASARLRVAPCAAPCKRPILGHGFFRIFSQVQAAANRLLFDCHEPASLKRETRFAAGFPIAFHRDKR